MTLPAAPLTFVTPTWAGDRLAVGLLRQSIERSPLSNIRHLLVVQSEDREHFTASPDSNLEIITSAALLPGDVEAMRLRAMTLQDRCGRHLTRLLGSLRRSSGWPEWPGHTGWHVQQISKLMSVLAADTETVVCLDSDVIVTPSAQAADFLPANDSIPCYSVLAPQAAASSKVRHWNEQAARLFGLDLREIHGMEGGQALYETCFDTPFIFRRSVVRAMCDWLEQRYQRPWWQTLLRQPARRWSEFATYRAFLRAQFHAGPVQWRRPEDQRYLFDASDPVELAARVAALMADPQVHYITIHSQSSGRQLWSAEHYIPALRDLLAPSRP